MSADSNTINVKITVDKEFEVALKRTIEQSEQEAIQAAGAGGVGGAGFGGSAPSSTSLLSTGARGLGGPSSIISMITPMVPYLVPIMIASGAATALFAWARGPGGPLDKRYLRDLMRETNTFMSRQLMRDTEVGNRQVIIQAQANFRNLGGGGNSNSLRQMRESGDRLSNIGIVVTDSAKGLEKII